MTFVPLNSLAALKKFVSELSFSVPLQNIPLDHQVRNLLSAELHMFPVFFNIFFSDYGNGINQVYAVH